jgi:Tol biopolymer transport system component
MFDPSNGLIAFQVQKVGTAGIAVINADGSEYRQVVQMGPTRDQPESGTGSPGWLRYGYIIFTSNRAGGPDDFHLFVVDPFGPSAGGDGMQLTSDPAQIEWDGVGSADGSTLAFAVAAATGDPNEPLRDVGLTLSDADGDNQRLLFTPLAGTFDDRWPDISPDGKKIAFSRGMGGDPGSARGSIFVANIDGTGAHELTDPELDAVHPRWSPDGRWIIFSSNSDNYAIESANVWVVAADGTGLRQLTFESGGQSQAFFPDFGPDSQHFVFLSDNLGRSGTQDLAILSLDGSPGCTLWKGSAVQFAGDPDWGPPAP